MLLRLGSRVHAAVRQGWCWKPVLNEAPNLDTLGCCLSQGASQVWEMMLVTMLWFCRSRTSQECFALSLLSGKTVFKPWLSFSSPQLLLYVLSPQVS